MSVKDIKAMIEEAGLQYQDCIEKAELIARGQQAYALLAPVAVRQQEPASSTDHSVAAFVQLPR
eukprot:1282417-Prymnesium_polylepis.1